MLGFERIKSIFADVEQGLGHLLAVISSTFYLLNKIVSEQ